LNQPWLRRRWLDFRFGHSLYLIFALTGVNFVLIFHRLLIERVEILNEVFSDLWFFTIVFVLCYIPISIVIGAWHRSTQMKVDQEQILLNNPFMARNFRVLIDLIEGTASKEEINKFRNLLLSIEKKAASK
jgi:hypothetical protein